MTRWGHALTTHKWLNIEDEPCGRYNGYDCYWTARLLPELLRDAHKLGQWEWWQDHGAPFQQAVVAMAGRGVELDKAALTTYKRKVTAELKATDRAVCDHATTEGFTYTDKFPNSRDQVAKLLFTHLGLRGGKVTASGKRPSVDQDALTRALRDLRVRDERHRLLLFHLFHRTRLQTILSRYLTLEAEDDGRVRPVVKLAHVKTMRLAYANPALQQWPEEARHIFRARDGCAFVSADYSQLEARLLAYYANDTPAIEVFEAGGDPHAANAMDLFNITPEQWRALENHDPYRNYAKSWLYRRMYGGTAASGDKKLFCPCPRCAAKMPSTLHLTPRDATIAEERYDARHPAVKQWQMEVEREVARTHRFPLLLGGWRYISSPMTRDLQRELKNIPMQSGGARVMIRAQNTLHRMGAPIVLQHHDSFLLEVPEGEVAGWVSKVREAMCEPVQVGKHTISLPVDCKVGGNWGRFHKDENPTGLRKLEG